jgi:hypothetical protein
LLRLVKSTAHSLTPVRTERSVINPTFCTFVYDWPIILIGPGALLLVVSHLFVIPILVLWVGVGKKNRQLKYLDVRNIIAGSHAEHLLEPADALRRLVKIISISFLKGGTGKPLMDRILMTPYGVSWTHGHHQHVPICYRDTIALDGWMDEIMWSIN